MFQLSTMEHRNDFHIFFSLTVNCENKLLEGYCVLRILFQRPTLLKLHLHTPGKMLPPNFYFPTKQQFSCYNPVKLHKTTIFML